MKDENIKLTKYSQKLRRNMTKQENHLWYDFLKKLPIPVKRQHQIQNYIVDFYIPSKKLVIEIDGSQHYDTIVEQDKIRDENLKKYGLEIMRFSNYDIEFNFTSVCQNIACKIGIDY